MTAVLIAATVLLLIVAASMGADLLAHYARYRQYLRRYPSTRSIRGRVWRATR